MVGHRLTRLFLLASFWGAAWADEPAYKDVTVSTRPTGATVLLDSLGTEKPAVDVGAGRFRLSRSDFVDPTGKEVERTLILRLRGHQPVRLSLGWGRLREGQPITDVAGNALVLPPDNLMVALQDNSAYILPPLLLGGIVLVAAIGRARGRQRVARIEEEAARLRQHSAQEAQRKAEQERQNQQAQAERAKLARVEAERQAEEAQKERARAEEAERRAASEMAELRERNKAFQAGGGKDPWLGFKINDYYLLSERIGSGAQGAVYKARRVKDHPSAPDFVAVKIVDLAAGSPEDSEDSRIRHRNEIAQGLKLTHPNWVRYFNGGELPNGFGFILLELIEGKKTLKALIRPEGMTLEQACKILAPVVAGLDFAHRLNIVHRDLKPENIFVTPTGELKIGDLGLAKNTQMTAHTATGMFLGTPAYCAPEQFMDSKGVTHQVDQYTLGVMAYELLSGHPPFVGDLNQLIMCKLQDAVPPIASQPEGVNQVLLKMLDRDPARRYPTVAEAFAALKQLAH